MKKVVKLGLLMAVSLPSAYLVSCGGGEDQTGLTDAQARRLAFGSLESSSVNSMLGQFTMTLLQNIQQFQLCPGGGQVSVTPNGNTVTMTFNNCRLPCDPNQPFLYVILNGTITITATDSDSNNQPEEVSITYAKDFSANDQCKGVTISFLGDYTISATGQVNQQGDICNPQNTQQCKGTATINGGPVEINYGNAWSRLSYNNLTFYFNNYDPANAAYEWSLNGGFTYQDNQVVTNPVSVNLVTTINFKGYDTTQCPYTGRLSINNDLIVLEAYDPDNDPNTENWVRVTHQGNVIFDNECTQLQ